MVMAFAKTRAHIDEYAKNKLWYWHVPLWLFGVYVFFNLLQFDLEGSMPFVVQVPHAFDFMLHEFAHVFTTWLPAMVTAAAGSASELILGLLLVYGAFQFRNYFASLFCCLWLMLVCMSVGEYMADAVPQQIPLVSLGGVMAGSERTVHDWHFIFGELNLLGASGAIGDSFKTIGIVAGVFGIVFSAWIMYKMAAAHGAKEPTEAEKILLKRSASHPTANFTPQDKNTIYPTPIKGGLADTVPEPPKSDDKQPPKPV